MEDLVTPDTLDVLDRRVYDFAVSPVPLAQIAVQLGVTVSQAEERIQRVCARLGVPDRAALREWKPSTAPESEDDVVGAPTEAEPSRRHSRRALIAAGGAGIAALAGGALAWRFWLADSDRENPAVAAETPEPTMPADAEATFITEVPFADNWEVKTFAKGELIDWPHGLFLMGVAGGEVRGHRLRATDAINYQTWGQGRCVAGERQEKGATSVHLMDILNAETSWSWPQQQLRLIGVVGNLPTATLIFETVSQNKGTGEISVVSSPGPGTDLEPSFRTAIYPTGFSAPLLAASSEKRVAVASLGDQITVTVIDLANKRLGGAAVGFPRSEADGASLVLTAFQNIQPKGPGSEAIRVAWGLFDPQTGKRLEEWMTTVNWDLSSVAPPISLSQPVTFSPDGSAYLREVALRNVVSESADGPREYWPAVEIVETSTGKVLRRVRSAAIYYGDGGPRNRWMGTDAFAALLRTEQAEDGYDFGTISTRTASGNWNVTTRYRFEADPSVPSYFSSPWAQGIVPSPTNPEVVALGKFATLNTREGQLVRANVRTETGPAHIDPWAAGSNWLTFAFPHLGHGGASPPVLLQPKFESPDTPIESPLRFKVSAQGDRLNLRDQPSLSGKVIAALEDGSTLFQAENAARPAGRRGLEQAADGSTWVYVSTPGDIAGWVNSAYLAWA